MDDPFMTVREGRGPVIAVAAHAGHDLRPEVADLITIDEDQRRYEEDPFTDRWAGLGDTSVIVHRSRFEVDLNRPRDGAVYPGPDAAWGLDVFGDRHDPAVVEASRRLHDAFYDRFGRLCEHAASSFGAFVVYDLHSYNHRRGGVGEPAADVAGNPDINVGTGSLDRERWGEVVDRFLQVASQHEIGGRALDVRENVRFTGGYLVDWVHDRFPDSGVALAIDVKKIHMDEHTGEPVEPVLTEIGRALAATVRPVVSALRRAAKVHR